MNFCLFPVGDRADQWALDNTALNTYSLPFAKTDYVNAVLGPNPSAREGAASDLFYTLGHVVHLLQDAGQPEHTRNDQHLPFTNVVLGGATSASIWEDWGSNNLVNDPTAVSFDGYPNVNLPTYESYFHTSDGNGFADFSNANFVTQDTNYDDEATLGKCLYYTVPYLGAAVERTESVAEAVRDPLGGDIIVTVDEDIYTSYPGDRYTGSTETDPFHTFLSVLDEETRLIANRRVFSLGDGSYLSRASMLMPRAVGYTAGFVDHFFRGKIDALWKQTSPGVYDLILTNRSEEPIGADAELNAVYRADPSYFGRTTSDDTAPIVTRGKLQTLVSGFAGLPPGASVTVSRVSPAGLSSSDCLLQFERRLTITGTLGAEANEVIGLVQPPSAPAATCESPQLTSPGCVDGVGCGTAGTLTAELTASTPTDVWLMVDATTPDGSTTFTYTCFSGCNSVLIPSSSVVLATTPGGPESVTVQVPAETRQYDFYARYLETAQPATMMLRILINGTQAKQIDANPTNCPSFVQVCIQNLGSYP